MASVLGRSALYDLDLTVSQGSTNSFEMRWSTEGDDGSTAPVDLTGYTARAQVRRSKDAAEAWITLDSGDEITLGPEGQIVITVPFSVTEDPLWDSRDFGVWDLELTSPEGVRVRLCEGVVEVSHEVTRA